jgi:c(7)-type cytochrome triheme protein
MKGTAALADGAMHEPSACGLCHDGKQSFSVEDDDKCVHCHVEGKGGK